MNDPIQDYLEGHLPMDEEPVEKEESLDWIDGEE